jgi:hypothetical protein
MSPAMAQVEAAPAVLAAAAPEPTKDLLDPAPPAAGEPAATKDVAEEEEKVTTAAPQRGVPMFEGAAPPESRGPFLVFLGLVALATAVLVLWIVFGAPAHSPETGPAAQPAPVQSAAAVAVPEVVPQARDPETRPLALATEPVEGLTADQVRRRLDEHKPALQGCVDEAVGRDPGLRVGRIHVATTVAPSGEVTAARIDQRIVDESPLGACLKRATKRILFPQFAGSAFDMDIPIVVRGGD